MKNYTKWKAYIYANMYIFFYLIFQTKKVALNKILNFKHFKENDIFNVCCPIQDTHCYLNVYIASK